MLNIPLQKVYVALNEPDGVAGVAAVRNSEPSIHNEIIEFESTGNLSVNNYHCGCIIMCLL